jgi:uncharacterized protein (UPF0548 family)
VAEAVADWRFLIGWSDAELRAHLAALRGLEPNFRTPEYRMTQARGWHHDRIGAFLGREPTGSPLRHGFYAGARAALLAFEFSDPRIVEVHYDPATPLAGRDVLLVIKALGLGFLCGVRVLGSGDRTTSRWTVTTLRLVTLEGHIERGTERIRLFKDHRTGVVHFRLASRWKPGQVPNWWSRVGFHGVNVFYRDTWHRHLRDRLRRAGRVAADARHLDQTPPR